MARQRSLQSKKPRSTALISAVALVLGLTTVPFTFQDITVAAAGIITHKADISHEKGSSPWPKYGEKPETNTPEIRKWVKMVDWSKVPKLPVRKAKSPGDPPECPSHIEEKDCWWTCSGCFAPDDIVECPGKNAWGLTFDDGPEPGTTENLFEVLKEKNVTATFFVTGMKSSRAPWLLQETIDQGHHLASHTWSHSGLTTLTNEEVVGELMWTQKYIYDHTGYKISYFRPPYGDIDNRVRAIARQLGFKTVIWSHNWDTQDWQLPEKTITQKQVVGIFKKGLSDLSARKRGVITLEHDGDKQMTNMARTLLDMGIKYGMKPMDIPKCMGDPIGYNEVPEDAVLPAPAPAPKKPAPPARQPPPSSPNVPVPASLKPGKVAKPAENIKPASINQDSPIKQASDNTDDSIQKTGTTEQGELSSLGDNKTSFAVPFGASYSSWSMACWTAAALLLGWTI